MVDSQNENRVDLARAAIGLGVALLVVVLGALGLQGESLSRAVRNFPVPTIFMFACVVLGLTLPFFYIGAKKHGFVKTTMNVIGILLLLSGAGFAVALAVANSAAREVPAIALAVSPTPASQTHALVSVTASATSLRAHEDVIVRVLGVKAEAQSGVRELCRTQTGLWEKDPVDSQVLAWTATGPDTNGKAAWSGTFAVSTTDFRYLCAFITLRDRDANKLTDDRSSWAVIDLAAVQPAGAQAPVEVTPTTP